MGHRIDKLHKFPIHLLGNEEVLRFTHHGGDATKSRAHSAMHDEASDKSPEPFE